MKKIILNFYAFRQLITVPDFIEADAFKYQELFFVWLNEPSNDHDLWLKHSNGRKTLSYAGNEIVDWLNNYVLRTNDEKAFMVDEYYDGKPDDYKILNF